MVLLHLLAFILTIVWVAVALWCTVRVAIPLARVILVIPFAIINTLLNHRLGEKIADSLTFGLMMAVAWSLDHFFHSIILNGISLIFIAWSWWAKWREDDRAEKADSTPTPVPFDWA